MNYIPALLNPFVNIVIIFITLLFFSNILGKGCISMDSNKNLKKQRTRKYFLKAAKEIIIQEGHEHVSVRRVADIAGYSFPTMYKYFKDVNELLWDAKQDMINDLVIYMHNAMPQEVYDINLIKKLFHTYIEYYFENPNVFKFFYFHQLTKPHEGENHTELQIDFTAMWKETFKGFVLNGRLQANDVEITAKTLIYAIHGILTLYLSSNGDLTRDNVYKDADKIIDHLLK